jgi:hypothetical protein
MAGWGPGDKSIDGNSEEALRARGDLVLLLARGALRPGDVMNAFAKKKEFANKLPSKRAIQMDVAMDAAARLRLKLWRPQRGEAIPELPAMSKRRALVYSALYRDLQPQAVCMQPFRRPRMMQHLEYCQRVASRMQPIPGKAVDEVLQSCFKIRTTSLTGRQYQEVRAALSLYLSNLRLTLLKYLREKPAFEKALTETRRFSPPLRTAQKRRRDAAQRLDEALELYDATRFTMQRLVDYRKAPPDSRKRTPLSDGEAKIIHYAYLASLDAPLPSLRKNSSPIRARVFGRESNIASSVSMGQ